MNLYIVRHGQTDGNVYKIMDGIRDIDLNEKGIEHAKLARDEIKDVILIQLFADLYQEQNIQWK